MNEKVRNTNNRLGKLLAAKMKDDEILTELYYATPSAARPFDDEKQIAARTTSNKREDKRKAWEDVVWAADSTPLRVLFRH